MATKSLSENNWKVLAQKNKVKDNGLQKALASYQALDEDRHDERLKAVVSISQLANSLKRAKEVAGKDEVADYLADVVSVAESEKREISKAKANAEKAAAAAAKAATGHRREEEEEQEGDEEEETEDDEEEEAEDQAADSYAKLAAALKTLKTSKKPYYFLACDAKPYGLVVSRKDIRKNAQAKKELSQVSGGSRRPPRFGECRYESGKYVFEMQKPPSGLARILQKWIKDATGLGVKVMVGVESGDEEVEVEGSHQEAEGADQASGEAQSEPAAPRTGASEAAGDQEEDTEQEGSEREATAPEAAGEAGQAAGTQGTGTPRSPNPRLGRAPAEWHEMRDLIDGKLNELKVAIRQAFAGEADDLLSAIEQGMNKLDGILGKLDKSLADSLEKANAATNPAARRAELNNSKTILANYINYIKSEPLIGQIDTNPFGVKTDLKKTLVEKLRQMAQAVG